MFEKNLEIGYLLDFYGDILPERRKDIMDLYYNDDLSLSEIADDLGITRQAVRETVKKTEAELLFYEEKLGLRRRFSDLESRVSAAVALCRDERESASPLLRQALEDLAETVAEGSGDPYPYDSRESGRPVEKAAIQTDDTDR